MYMEMITYENAFTDQSASKSFTGYSSCVNNKKYYFTHLNKDSKIPPH